MRCSLAGRADPLVKAMARFSVASLTIEEPGLEEPVFVYYHDDESGDAAGWLQDISPFHYYLGGEPLRCGPQVADSAVLVVVGLGLVAAGGLRFDRRAWPSDGLRQRRGCGAAVP